MSIENRGPNKWRFRVRKDGQNYTMNFVGTEKEAYKEHKKFEVDIMRGEIGLNENMKFGELAQKVLDEYVRANLKYGTQQIYIVNYNNHILPVFGSLKIGSIKTYALQKFFNDMAKKYKPLTVEKAATVISVTFEKAVEWGLLKESPYRHIVLPKREKKNMSELLSMEQIEKLFAYYDQETNLLHKSAFYLATCCGMRNSEIRALEETDIDFVNGVINVNKQDGEYLDDAGNFTRGDTTPKTVSSARKIYAPKFVLDTINSYIKQLPYRSIQGKLFYNVYTGMPITRHCLSKRFKTVAFGLGLPDDMRFHDLRHLHATLLINSGATPASVAKRMGHSKITTTLDTYTHSIDALDKSTGDLMDNVVTDIKKRAN